MAGSTEKKLGGKPKPKEKSKSKPKKHKIRHFGVEPTDNGGFIARHQFQPEEGQDGGPGEQPTDETHALGDNSALLSHVQSQFGGSLPAPEAGGGGAAGPAGPGGM